MEFFKDGTERLDVPGVCVQTLNINTVAHYIYTYTIFHKRVI